MEMFIGWGEHSPDLLNRVYEISPKIYGGRNRVCFPYVTSLAASSVSSTG